MSYVVSYRDPFWARQSNLLPPVNVQDYHMSWISPSLRGQPVGALGSIGWPISPAPTSIPAGYKFGAERQTTSPPHPHGGLDLGSAGQTVYAAEDGTVTFAGYSQSLGGLMVYIKHSGGWETRYMHLASGSVTVKAGDTVRKGQTIAKVGSTGIQNSPAHLHFEVLKDGTRLDPEKVIGGLPWEPFVAAGLALLYYWWNKRYG